MIFVVWLLLLAAVAWIGGMLFLSLVMVPAFKREGFAGERRALFHTLALRFRLVVWASIVTLIATGPVLLISRVESLAGPAGWPVMLKLKLTPVLLLIALTAGHDFWLGPRVGRILQLHAQNRTAVDRMLVVWSPWIARLSLP